jgi:hypothetical protein
VVHTIASVINLSGTFVSKNHCILIEVQKIYESLKEQKARGVFRNFRDAASLIDATISRDCNVQNLLVLQRYHLLTTSTLLEEI